MRRLSYSARALLCSLLLIAATLSTVACQSPGGGTRPTPAPGLSQRPVRGTVTDPAGLPAQGAVVTAYEAKPAYLYGREILRQIGRQETGPDGAFRFLVSPDAPRTILVATKPGLGFAWASQASQFSAPISLHMSLAAQIAGRVVDHNNKPVPGAALAISVGKGHGDYINLGDVVPGLATSADANGCFRFQGLPARQSIHFEVTAPGHGQLDTITLLEDGYTTGQNTIELGMPESATLEVAVVDRVSGRPIPDVPLLFWYKGSAAEHVGKPVPGAPGHVRWTDIAPGNGSVFVGTPFDGHAPYISPYKRLECKAGKVEVARMEVLTGEVAEVCVRDAKTATPIAGAQVYMQNRQIHASAIGRTDHDGVARILVAPGEYQEHGAEAPHYRELRSQEKVIVQAGKPLRLEFAIERSPCYRGTVFGVDGRPAAGVSVAVLGDMAQTSTDTGGAFELYPAFYDTTQTPAITLVARQEASNLAATVTTARADTPLQIHLQQGTSHDVVVVDPDGNPVPGADATIALGHCNARPEGARFHVYTDQAGRGVIRAVPASLPVALCVQGTGFAAQAQMLPATTPGTSESHRIQLQRATRLPNGPVVKEISVPVTPNEDSIWGGTGRDSRGHIWFCVCKSNKPGASADLFEFIPESGEVVGRGNVVDELKRAGLLRPDEQQMKIHSKIYQIDGYLYCVSMDEKGEDEQKLSQPIFGSHLWRLRLADNTWEHLLTIPEAMVGIAVGAGKVYCLGYWNHVLYQYDIATRTSKNVIVGSCFAHVSRNLVADSNGHVYVPRCSQAAGMLEASLVEYDDQLREIASTSLPQYYDGEANRTFGITGLASMPDGSLAFVTHNGWLTIIHPQPNGPGKVEHLGWFNPGGASMSDSLFVDKTGRYLMGVSQNSSRVMEWITYDLQTGRQTVAPFSDGKPDQPSWRNVMLYGSMTRDDQGRCYVTGQTNGRNNDGYRPLLIQVTPSPGTTD